MGIETPYHSIKHLVILAPNWLGDAVMALPAIADVRRAAPSLRVVVAARPPIAPLFLMVTEINEVITLEHEQELVGRGFGAALLLPNSFRAAWIALRAKIPERWGYRAQCRTPLLTRPVDPPSGLHQVEYYQQLVHALEFPNGPLEPRVDVPAAARDAGAQLLRQSGWDGHQRLVALAPGAAYGSAKRWPATSFADLGDRLASDDVRSVLIGTAADAPAALAIKRASASRGSSRLPPIDLVGRTDLPMLAGVLASCRALVTNDSGAMHLAGAIGIAVTAVFGPTDERVTRPLGDRHVVVTGRAWCRPCMLRDCPLDHRCMRGIDVARVVEAARQVL